MATQSIAAQVPAIKGLGVSAVGVTLIVLGAGTGVGYIFYASGVIRMIAASLANYIGIFA